jgi:hypothetical protein
MGPARDHEGLHIVRLVHERSPETRIVILTAYGSSEIEDEARLLGADAFCENHSHSLRSRRLFGAYGITPAVGCHLRSAL